jgi:hypothetical protein
MKHITLFAFILLSFGACRQKTGSGNIISEKKNVEEFTGISAGSAFTVEVKIGSPASVEIEADDNIINDIEAKVTGNTLKIHFKNKNSIRNGHFKALVTTPSLNDIESTGAANITILDEIKNNDKIRLHSSGAAKITARVDAPEVEAETSGAGTITISGRTKDVDAKASGGANIYASDLLSENVDAHASGAGNVHVYASVKLKAHASGAGNVHYKGGATDVKADESGAGNVKKED